MHCRRISYTTFAVSVCYRFPTSLILWTDEHSRDRLRWPVWLELVCLDILKTHWCSFSCFLLPWFRRETFVWTAMYFPQKKHLIFSKHQVFRAEQSWLDTTVNRFPFPYSLFFFTPQRTEENVDGSSTFLKESSFHFGPKTQVCCAKQTDMVK